MRTTKRKATGAIAVFATMLMAQAVFAYYNPSTGRFLSRDPLGEPGFQLVQTPPGSPGAWASPAGQRETRWIDRGSAKLVDNDTVNSIDGLGLWKVDRKGGAKARAVAEEGDTIWELADLIGLDGADYEHWLTVPSGTDLLYHSHFPCGEQFEVPNTVVAYWAGWGGDVGRDYVQWVVNVGYLRSLGFFVDERNHVTGASLPLRSIFVAGSTAKELHGLYFWGHGGAPYPSDSLWSQSDDPLVLFNDTGLAYGMAFGAVFACDTNSGQSALMSSSSGAIWHGTTGTYVPHPFHPYTLSHWIKHGDQGTH